MIRSFADKRTAAIFAGFAVRGLPHQIQARAKNESAGDRCGRAACNRLQALHGERRGQHSIRINEQWRVRFRWRDGTGKPGTLRSSIIIEGRRR